MNALTITRTREDTTHPTLQELWDAAKDGGHVMVNNIPMFIELTRIDADLVNGGSEEFTFTLTSE